MFVLPTKIPKDLQNKKILQHRNVAAISIIQK